MTTVVASAGFRAAVATLNRELLSYRINRFLYLHVCLMLAIGLLALFAPPEAASTGAAWWIMNGVMYVASLSALLLGLSSAQAEADEFPLLFTQPLRVPWWVAGKGAGLLAVVTPAAALLVIPTLLTTGGSWLLVGTAAAAAGLSLLFAWLGLALGLWIHDPVRGLIAALAAWCVLLFGVDLLLIAIGGAGWVHVQPAPWVAVLMLSPLDAFRVTLLFAIEGTAFAAADLHPLTRWWLDHTATWFVLCIAGWCVFSAYAAIMSAERRRSD
jgi:hypothetical protein